MKRDVIVGSLIELGKWKPEYARLSDWSLREILTGVPDNERCMKIETTFDKRASETGRQVLNKRTNK